MLAANAAVFLGAHAILRRAATGNGAVDLVFFLLLRLTLVSAVVLVAGWTHQLTPAVLGIAGVAALAFLVFKREHRALRRPEVPNFGKVLPILALVVLVRLLLQVWFFAPYNYDAISYHLTKIPEWVRAGGFTRQMGVDTHATFPAGFELVETWWVVFLHHDALIEFAGVEFLALAAAATFALARTVGLGDRSSFFAALIYVLTPGVQISSTSCLNDVPVAAMVLSIAALLAARAPLAWTVLALGVGVGIKPTTAYAVPGLLLTAALVRKRALLENRLPRVFWGLAATGVLIGFSWYFRNYLWFGNPIHPVGTQGLINSLGKVQIQFGPSPKSGGLNLLELLNHRMADDYLGYGSLLAYISGWGAVAFACGLLALLPTLKERPAFRQVFLGLTVSLLCVLVLVNHDPWCLRFVLWYPAVLAIATVHVAESIRPMQVVAVVGLAYQFIATFFPVDLPLSHVRTLSSMGWRERSMARIFQAECTARTVAYFIREPIHNRGESYLLYQPDYSCRVVYPTGKTTDYLIAEMDREQVRLLYQARNNPTNEPILNQAIRRNLLQPRDARFLSRP